MEGVGASQGGVGIKAPEFFLVLGPDMGWNEMEWKDMKMNG